ncbi:MAG: DnaB-like helicase C-terminal domain-containing protein [Gemmataceae bacterium]
MVALAQVNRASEDRQDHRPRLSDLRESGCLAGDTLVTLANSGRRVPIRELVGRQGVSVWSLDERSLRLRPAQVSRACCTGVKPVYRLRTRLGRCIRATANHPFRAYQGWRRLDELAVGDYVAVPRVLPCGGRNTLSAAEAGLLGHLIGDGCTLPRHAIQYTTRERDLADRVAALAVEVFGARICPRVVAERTWFQVYLTASERLTHGRHNAVAEWLTGLGVFGLRSWEKRVPDVVFEQPHEVVSAFLRSLWATDGCIRPAGRVTHYPAVFYASSSEALADGVQALLLRLGINGRRRVQNQGEKGRPQHQVWLSGHDDLVRFTHQVGAVGAYRCEALATVERWLEGQAANTNRDIIPRLVWHHRAVPLMRERGISMRSMQAAMGMAFCGSSLYKQNLSRERLARVATAVGGDEVLTALAGSDVYWDRVERIEPAGEEEVFDLTVPGPHNFVANEIVVHNSIEQDADAVLMLHRPDRYEPGQQEGVIEIIVAKNRQGPVGEVTLAYIKQYLRYEDFKVGTPFDG